MCNKFCKALVPLLLKQKTELCFCASGASLRHLSRSVLLSTQSACSVPSRLPGRQFPVLEYTHEADEYTVYTRESCVNHSLDGSPCRPRL